MVEQDLGGAVSLRNTTVGGPALVSKDVLGKGPLAS